LPPCFWFTQPRFFTGIRRSRPVCNDVAEEALRGLLLIQERRIEPITRIIGNSAETGYLYLLGLSSQLLGSSPEAVQVVSSIFALAVVALTAVAARLIDGTVPLWLPAGVAASSVWLFHYARSGLRAISAPLFLLLFVIFMSLAERGRRYAVLAGVVLGLGMYGYTAFRIVPLGYALYVLVQMFTVNRRRVLSTALLVGSAALVVSIPNLISALHSPREFFLRGSYVMRGGASVNTLASALLPFGYLDDSYREIAGPHHLFDGVSAGLASAHIGAVHLLIAIAAVAGAIIAWRRRMPTGLLTCIYATGIVALGPTGPSLTRMLVLLPVILLFATIALRAIRPVIAIAIIVVVAAHHGTAYFSTLGQDEEVQANFSPAATPMGQRAADLGREGRRVLCVVTRDANVINYLAFDQRDHVTVAEFYRRPFAPTELPLGVRFGTIMIERSPALDGAHRLLRGAARTDHPRFSEYHVQN
jgi:hypothetical protein